MSSDPEPAIERAIAELSAVAELDAARADTWAMMGDLLALRARAKLAQHKDIASTIAEARAKLERSFAAHREFEMAVRARMEVAAVAAEARLARGADPSAELAPLGADVQRLSALHPTDGRIARMASRMELLAAHWALAQRRPADAAIGRAADAAASARQLNASDAHAWTASAEVELTRSKAAIAAGRGPDTTAITRAIVFAERALKIDPVLVSAKRVRQQISAQQ